MPRGVKGSGPKGKVTQIKTVDITVGSDHISVSPELKAAITFLRPKLQGFADEYKALTIKKGELAEPFMDGAALWARETGRSFVDYVRAIDPTVPGDREGYRTHTSYMAADYLRRAATVGSARAGNNAGGRAARPTRTNATGRMARLLATVLKIVKAEDHAAIWQAIADQLAMTPRQITGLKAATDATQPLFTLEAKRPVHAEVVKMSEAA